MAKNQLNETPSAGNAGDDTIVTQPTDKRFSGLQSKMTGRWLSVLFVVLFLAAAGTAGYFYRQLRTVKNDPTKAAQAEVKALIAEVGKLMVLPDNEQPTVATVTDASKLQDQPFFIHAEKDDKVLIYTDARKAVLYRPSKNIIVEVAPINIGNTTTANNAPPAQSQVAGASTAADNIPTADKSQIPIKVLNGTKVSGLARQVADKLQQAGYGAVSVSDASGGAQAQTTISYERKYSSFVSDISYILNNQATLQEQAVGFGITVVLGTSFTIE